MMPTQKTPSEFLQPLVDSETPDQARLSSEVLRQLKIITGEYETRSAQVVMLSGGGASSKTYAAQVLASQLGRPLFRIDLAGLVNKYIGETEKNLSTLFDTAESQNVILLFNEADSLFVKRTLIKDTHDRYANLDTNLLLKRIEAYSGLVIVVTNYPSELDETLLRLVRWTVEISVPEPVQRPGWWQRLVLWRRS